VGFILFCMVDELRVFVGGWFVIEIVLFTSFWMDWSCSFSWAAC